MGEITLRKALDDYQTIYMPYRNFADRTRVEYQNDLEDFIEYLGLTGNNQIRELNIPIIERYAANLEQKGFASVTRKRRIVAIRSFLRFLHQEGHINTNLAEKVVVPYIENKSPFVLTQAECNRLRMVCANDPKDAAIVELFLQTGITLSELVNLTVDDTQLGEIDRGFMRIRGSRRRKERMIPLNTKASTALNNYFAIREQSENSTLFLNRFDKPLGMSGVQKILRKYLEGAKIGGASIHTLRHTFGAQHVAKGTSIKTIQNVLGLKDARSTAIYQALAREVVSRELQTNSL